MNRVDVTKYYLSKNKLSNDRLNMYLFLSQVVYIAKYGRKLIENDFIVHDNKLAVKTEVNNYDVEINERDRNFLDKMYDVLKDASYEELVEIVNEDPEWTRVKNSKYNNQVLKLENNIEIYKKRYKGFMEAVKI